MVYAEDGELWLSYGSFWSGIYILRLDKNTGKPIVKGFGKQIAGRHLIVQGRLRGLIAGTWDTIILVKYDNSELTSRPVKLLTGGKIAGSGKSNWQYTPGQELIINLYNRDIDEMATYTCRVLPSWDWENHQPTLVFTGIAKNGEAIWGKKLE